MTQPRTSASVTHFKKVAAREKTIIMLKNAIMFFSASLISLMLIMRKPH